MILGIDEVGRGAWAGPLVVGAVVLGGQQIDGLTDSKKLTPKRRSVLAREIKEKATAIGLGWVSAETIDKIGLSEALKMATRLAVKDIDTPYDEIIIDGTIKLLDDPRVTTMKQADLLVPSVSAASIIAKVARDYYMSEVANKDYPQYGFKKHVGYGTAIHSETLAKNGPSLLHRLSFTPVKKTLGMEFKSTKKSDKITSTAGRIAEDAAATHLEGLGFRIIDKNWRTKLCEVDVVAQKDSIVHLIEVKYRKIASHGDGLNAITPKKLKQMKFAARVWQHWHSHNGDIQLDAISMSGTPPVVDDFLENLR
ncbi:MAG: ribonuclease HII [Candidatus Saccharibacteria bacterium]|nr:ribonuclease HII [Candidatus Saccharibacteria bacterium]